MVSNFGVAEKSDLLERKRMSEIFFKMKVGDFPGFLWKEKRRKCQDA